MIWINGKKVKKMWIGSRPVYAMFMGDRLIFGDIVSSCFSSGVWLEGNEWNSDDAWKNE